MRTLGISAAAMAAGRCCTVDHFHRTGSQRWMVSLVRPLDGWEPLPAGPPLLPVAVLAATAWGLMLLTDT